MKRTSNDANDETLDTLPTYREAVANDLDAASGNVESETRLGEQGALLDRQGSVQESTPLLAEVSISVPNSTEGRPAPPPFSVYRAEYTSTAAGILSHDEHINNDAEALCQFLHSMVIEDKPSMRVRIKGWHDETKTRIVREYDHATKTEEVRYEHYTEREIDFLFDVDVSAYIAPHGQDLRVMVGDTRLPIHADDHGDKIRELCADYIRSPNTFKYLTAKKQVVWDFHHLTRALQYAIHTSTPFNMSTIDITFPLKNYSVQVAPATRLARWIKQDWVLLVLFFTCTWIIVIPIYLFFSQWDRYDDGRGRRWFRRSRELKCDFYMVISEEEWYERSVTDIVRRVRMREGWQGCASPCLSC